MANPDKVKVGAGILYIAPLGTTEPTDLTTPWATVDADWEAIGYTEEGHEFSSEPNFEPIDVAEELEPIRYEQSANASAVTFSAAEMTVDNLTRAFNGGTVTTLAGTVVRFEPPEVGDVTYAMLGWESNDAEERFVFRKCLQVGNVAIARRKAPTKALIPMEFRLVVPSAGVRSWTSVLETA
jgi:hypothetical protein